jgi:hypothetical protein
MVTTFQDDNVFCRFAAVSLKSDGIATVDGQHDPGDKL